MKSPDWHEYFIYRDGDLIWKERPRSHFKSDAIMKQWNGRHIGALAGSVTGYENSRMFFRKVHVDSNNYFAHRIVWEMHNGPLGDLTVNHCDHNGTNNRIENLRLVAPSEHGRNSRMSSGNTSGVTGVSFDKSKNRWRAKICVGGRSVYLGVFTDLSCAALARKRTEVKYGFHKNHGIAL